MHALRPPDSKYKLHPTTQATKLQLFASGVMATGVFALHLALFFNSFNESRGILLSVSYGAQRRKLRMAPLCRTRCYRSFSATLLAGFNRRSSHILPTMFSLPR